MLPSLPVGGIGLWYGSVGTIPNNHQLCDGTNGTPDLRDKIPVGAGNTYNPNDNGGNVQHSHVINANSHYHNISLGNDVTTSGVTHDAFTSDWTVTGTAVNENNLPPYKSLCYIQRIA